MKARAAGNALDVPFVAITVVLLGLGGLLSGIGAGPAPEPPARPAAELSFVAIPAGSVLMGSKDGEGDERPMRRVAISAFEMGRTEVTVAQYRLCVEAEDCEEPQTPHPTCSWNDGRADHPMNCVSWRAARDFARWAGARLPSEAEWQYAARAGRRTNDPSDESAEPRDRSAWYRVNSTGTSHPVAQRAANALGLYDVLGNVWEWIEDDYHPSYVGIPADGSPWVSRPRNASRVVRGGSWRSGPQEVRIGFRSGQEPSNLSGSVGFRLAR